MSDFTWCLHCERTYRKGQFRPSENGVFPDVVLMNCPYPDCDGDVYLDGWDWDELRTQEHTGYPEVPLPGVVYPLYPVKRKLSM